MPSSIKGRWDIGHSASGRKTLVFYRDRIVSVAWDGVALCAVTIEPFEVSLRGGRLRWGYGISISPGWQMELLRGA
jgi:hypothetical protein